MTWRTYDEWKAHNPADDELGPEPEEDEGKIYYCTICGEEPVDAVNGYDTCPDCLKRPRYRSEPEPREDKWEHWAGPFVNRAVAEQCALNLNVHSFAREWYLFEVFPDEAVEGKWVIKRTWK